MLFILGELGLYHISNDKVFHFPAPPLSTAPKSGSVKFGPMTLKQHMASLRKVFKTREDACIANYRDHD